MDKLNDPTRIGRRSFVGWMGKVAAGAAALLGGSVGYAPRALAVHNAGCISPKQSFTGPCSTPGFGDCVVSGNASCMDVCMGNLQCIINNTGDPQESNALAMTRNAA